MTKARHFFLIKAGFICAYCQKLSKLSDLNPIYINMLISDGTATVSFIYLMLKVIRVTGYQVGIFPGTYRYLRGQEHQKQVYCCRWYRKVVETDRPYPHIRHFVYFYGLITRSLWLFQLFERLIMKSDIFANIYRNMINKSKRDSFYFSSSDGQKMVQTCQIWTKYKSICIFSMLVVVHPFV